MVGWHRRLNGHEFEQTLGDGEGQGSLACCSPWGRKEMDMTEQQQEPVIVLPGDLYVSIQKKVLLSLCGIL